MKVNKDNLLSILASVRPGLAKKEFIEQATHVLFMGKNIATYNDRICVIAPYETDFVCSVKGEEFYKAVESVNEEEVEITLVKDQIKLNAKKTKAGMSTVVGENEKVEGFINKLSAKTTGNRFWKAVPDNFIQGLNLCAMSASKDMTSGVRCCVASKEETLFSTDGLRISKFVMSKKMDDLLIPARDAIELVKYPVTHYGASEGWLHFKTKDNIQFHCKTMMGDYPFDSIRKIFRVPVNEITLPIELQNALKAAAVFAEGDVDVVKSVEILIDKKKIICKSEKERGWIIKEIDLEEYSGPRLQFYINPIFFAQILDKSTSFSLSQKIDWPDKAIFTREDFTHIIALPELDQ